MLKIQCPKCSKSFIWTDSMPLTGKCPTQDCNWTYNVHEQIKKSVAEKIGDNDKTIRCPNCLTPIKSKWTMCGNCESVIVGARAFTKGKIFIFVVIILIIASIVIKYWP